MSREQSQVRACKRVLWRRRELLALLAEHRRAPAEWRVRLLLAKAAELAEALGRAVLVPEEGPTGPDVAPDAGVAPTA
jgi:hypothetical protein